jgi:hypothetical protein
MPEKTPVEAQAEPAEIFEPANTVLIGQDAIARRLGVTLKEAEALCAGGDLKAERTGEIWSVAEADLADYLREREGGEAPRTA